MYGSAHALGSALVNERYSLKGGLDTPGLMETAQEDNMAMMGNGSIDARRRVRDGDARRTVGGQPVSGPLARERNGVGRLPSSPNGPEQKQEGWTRFAFGLVGKVFTFGTSVIKGFYAGGGEGYEIRSQYPRQRLSPVQWMHSQRFAGGGTPIPGSWQEDEFLGDFEQDNPTNSGPSSPTSTSRPAAKRRQTGEDTWVMVATADGDAFDATPRQQASPSGVSRDRPAAASRANSRRSIAPVSRRSASYVSHNGSPALQQLSHDSHGHARRASIAPTRSPHSSRPSSSGQHSAGRRGSGFNLPTDSGVSPEVERFAKRQARQEKVADRTMNNMNRKLADMIQQAQVALGTKYAVEGDAGGGMYDEDTDEGFVDEEW